MTEFTVDTKSAEVSAMMAQTQRIADIDAGGDNMRAKGDKYLPQFPQEDDASYKARKDSTWLFNGVRKTVKDMTGKLFAKPVTLAQPDDNPLNELMSNVDMEGRDLSNFGQDVFKAGLKRGLSFIMVDAPRREGEFTAGQAQELGLRPSMTLLPLDCVIGWQWVNINNRPQLTQFRIAETAEDPGRTEFSDETVEQVRVLDLIDGRVQVRIYRSQSAGNGPATSASGLELVETYTTDQTEIMVTPFYTDRTGFLTALSPLDDLAEVNLAHWRSQSDQANIMHHARAPMKYFHGYTAEDMTAFTESPGYAFVNSNEAAEAGVIEHSGQAIAAGRTELKDMEFQMQAMGLQLVISKTGNNTATGDSIDEGKANGTLTTWADNLKDALEIAAGWMADLAGVAAETDVFVNKQFAALDHLTMDQVRDMYVNGVISKHTYIQEGRRRGVLDESVDAADEEERIGEEGIDGVDEVTDADDAI